MSFDFGNFNNWIGYSWIYSIAKPQYNTDKTQGIIYRRHTIISDNSAYDSNTGNVLKMIPSGYNYSARLGDGFISSDRSFRCWHQSLQYRMTIDSSNALLILKFACVLQYATDHDSIIEPRFQLILRDENGEVIKDCSNYNVYASNQYVQGFNTYILPNTNKIVRWRDWTTVGADLMQYYGKTVTVEFMSADCERNFHFGYAYFVASCQPLYITVKYCGEDSIARLTAPEGFVKYVWSDKKGTIVDSTQNLNLINPANGDTYKCTMKSETGCYVALQSTIAKYLPKANYSSRFDCQSNTVQLINLSSSTNGSLQYKWDFGDGNFSFIQNPKYTFSTSGLHPISLVVKNPPSVCTDTLKKSVETFFPPMIGITGDSTYCPKLSTTLKAFGAYRYEWSDGSTADSIIISAPGGKYWVNGYSSTHCKSKTSEIEVTEDPDWPLNVNNDTILCERDSICITMSGTAVKYLWNNGSTKNFFKTNAPGSYYVTGTNKRGCNKTRNFIIPVYPLPNSEFTLSDYTLNKRHNQITCSINNPQKDIHYTWNLDDGSIMTGSSIQHAYDIDNEVLKYTIYSKAKSSVGCSDSTFKIIDVTPFVPNVFSPNGDGINDLFMPGYNIKVFDRNGLPIFEGFLGWDGKYKGQLMDPDTYFYLLKYLDRNSNENTLKGFVTLVR